MKIAYVAHVGSRSLGVLAKVNTQTAVWRELGHDARLFCVSDAAPPGNPAYFHWQRFNLFNPRRALLADLTAFRPDLIYWRPSNATLHTAAMLARFGRRVVIEVNSNYRREGREYAQKSLSELRTYYQNVFAEPLIARCIAGYVCVTHELTGLRDFAGQKNLIAVPNGILLTDDMLCKKPSPVSPVRLLFMGSPGQNWHGVDVLPTIAKNLGHDYHIHVIGPRVEQLGIDEIPANITVHGYLDKNAYRPLLANMHIGIGSMAFFRNEMYEACPLKVREYIASGLPVILPYNDTAFRESCPDWVLQTPNEINAFTESAVINSMRVFCEKHRNKVVSHEESSPYIDARRLEARKLEQICAWVAPG